jgi:hypothetical protein
MYNKYIKRLRNFPASGEGRHPGLLGVSNLGTLAGIAPHQIYEDLRRLCPDIPDREISAAIKKALTDHNGGTFTPRQRPRPVVTDSKKALQRIIGQSDLEECDLWEASPRRIFEEPQHHAVLFLSNVFEPDELIFIGNQGEVGRPGQTIRTVNEWIEHFRQGGKTSPFIIVNPLTGKPAPKKGSPDEMTFRGDNNVLHFKFCLVEFDNLTLEEQYRFWSAAKLPIRALIFTGGKSIHAWLDVSQLATVETSEQWDTNIRQRLYERLLAPLGVDKLCHNPARLSRLPGHYRAEKQAFQRIIWLSTEGKTIC